MFVSGYVCDNCKEATIYQRDVKHYLPSKTHLIRYARDDGWSVGKQILCPVCRGGKKT